MQGLQDRFRVVGAETVLGQGRQRRVVRENEIGAFPAFAVRVAGGVEETVLLHLRRHEVGDLFGGAGVGSVAEGAPGACVEFAQQTVVVGHLLEVRHPPFAVDAVAAETAVDEIVHAAAVHRRKGMGHHLSRRRVVLQQRNVQQGVQRRGMREFRLLRKAAVDRFVIVFGLHDEGADDGRFEHGRLLRARFGLQVVQDFVGILEELLVAFGHFGRDDPGQFGETEYAVARSRRDIGPGEEGFVVRRAEDRGRPAAGAAVEQLVDLLVVFVQVGALLAVDLDADEVLVEKSSDLFVLEDLVFHDMAPVAAAVADGDEKGPLFASGPFKGLVAPRVPVDGVILVLLQVGRVFVRQSVRHV